MSDDTESRPPDNGSCALDVRGLSFAYPDAADPSAQVLRGADLQVPPGSFVLLVGGTGSGKTTLLRLCKPEIAPAGRLEGVVRVCGRDVQALPPAESASLVGYVFQDPGSQIVCDTVWHEMAFGLENLGVPQAEMRRRVAETCYFFGMEPWFHARTADLSGGQRQLLALASVLTMRPRLLLLDESTSMLDPVAEGSFLSMLYRVNRELGVTVVVATHRPAPMVEYATGAFRIADGRVAEVPLDDLAGEPPLLPDVTDLPRSNVTSATPAISVREAWFRYQRDADWVLRGLDLSIAAGEVRAVVGGNGSGKSTLLALVAGVVKPQRGRVANELGRSQAFLPQNPKALLSCQSVREELMEWAPAGGYGLEDAVDFLSRLGFDDSASEGNSSSRVLDRHPYDLSGGEQQLLALAKLLLVRPRLLLLDEPTKGLDRRARTRMARVLLAVRDAGATVIMATHDLAFAKEVADSVSLLFDGGVTLTQPCGDFFRDSWVWRA